jgi:hypothetical protein
MAVFTLTEQESPGDFFQKKRPKPGGPWLIIERKLVDANGNQVGSFTVRGTFVKKLPHKNAVVAINGTNRITGQGDICTQGVFRDFDTPPVIIAIVGGTGQYKDARGIVRINSPQFTFEVT